MSKQIKLGSDVLESDCKRFYSKLLGQDIYIKDSRVPVDVHTSYPDKKYYELQRKVVKNGIVEELVQVDYPVTPESVKSQLGNADFKRDVLGSIANAPKRQNLGDITGIQNIISMDSQQAMQFLNALQVKFQQAAVEKAAAEKAAAEKAAAEKAAVEKAAAENFQVQGQGQGGNK